MTAEDVEQLDPTPEEDEDELDTLANGLMGGNCISGRICGNRTVQGKRGFRTSPPLVPSTIVSCRGTLTLSHVYQWTIARVPTFHRLITLEIY